MIPYGKHHIDDEDIEAVIKVLHSNFLTQGPKAEIFEKAVADYVGARFAVAVTSGTAALHIAALAVDPAPGSTFVTSSITFVASANAARYAGCNLLFVDIDPESVNMSPASLQSIVSDRDDISAIIPVHFGGLACDMTAIADIARKKNAVVIEDAAHALGATYADGGRVGCCSNSLMTVFSFHPVKNIACGEGGLVTTNDESIYRKLLRLRSHGINKLDDPLKNPVLAVDENGDDNPWYYEMQELGFNYRLTDIQSALGLSQLSKLERFLARRIEMATRYDKIFSEFENCEPIQNGKRSVSGNHLYVLRINFQRIGLTRAMLMTELHNRGIGSQVHYIPVPSHPYYRDLGHDPRDCPQAWQYYEEALTIPLYVDLTLADQDRVVAAIKDLVG